MEPTSIDSGLAAALAERLDGEVIAPTDPAYDDARSIWNGMIDRHPALIARCRGTADVVAAVLFARERELPLTVRGGGHNVAGGAVADGALVVDLSQMRAVHVDADARRAWVQGGATWADVDTETQRFGLAAPGGVVSQTGVAGLTLNGGVSWHRRKHGMTIDNLVGAEVVTADGRVVRATATENADLLWALRGGGGNFGVVTAFEYRLHELGPEVAFLFVPYPVDQAAEVFRAYRDLVASAPDELTVDFGIERFAPDPELPPELHGVMYAGVFGMYAGPVEEGLKALQPYRELGTPILDATGPYPFTGVQTMLDPKFPDGVRRYWKALYLDSLSDEMIDAAVERAVTMPSDGTLVFMRHLGGAMGRVPAGATAFGDRRAQFMLSIDSSWIDQADDDVNVEWTREFWSAFERWSGGRTYFNFAGQHEEGDAALRASYGANYERLVDVKTKWDPDNVFHTGQNIRPRAAR
ncbi:MAG TPA: FAD-binding oxidoreductase [Solirubrobacteraceae bacterium]|nr:FAD-binding oxidoreductase [Solirubrobacteraceae bacterium]